MSESYHAGKSFSERHRVQSNFMSKVTRIIVATIAFGMGIDKADVRSVIHYNCPRTLEQYVQEIGRAGRDGELARCHMFFNDEDVVRHRSLVFSDGVEKSQIMSILRSIFSTRDGVSDGQRIYHCLKIERIEKFLDMRSPVIETILVGLERQSPSEVKICPNVHAECALSFHKSDVDVLSSQSLVIENIINKSRCRLGKYYVQLDHIANEMQISIQELQKELIALKVTISHYFDSFLFAVLICLCRKMAKFLWNGEIGVTVLKLALKLMIWSVFVQISMKNFVSTSAFS